jgi:uncharacterized protein YgiM (DUF1202 family)
MITKKPLLPSLLLAFLFAVSRSPAEFIHADVANVRSRPSARADLVARLPINASVTVEKTEDPWAYISVDNSGDDPIRGWVIQRILGKAYLPEDAIETPRPPEKLSAAL